MLAAFMPSLAFLLVMLGVVRQSVVFRVSWRRFLERKKLFVLVFFIKCPKILKFVKKKENMAGGVKD